MSDSSRKKDPEIVRESQKIFSVFQKIANWIGTIALLVGIGWFFCGSVSSEPVKEYTTWFLSDKFGIGDGLQNQKDDPVNPNQQQVELNKVRAGRKFKEVTITLNSREPRMFFNTESGNTRIEIEALAGCAWVYPPKENRVWLCADDTKHDEQWKGYLRNGIYEMELLDSKSAKVAFRLFK